MKVKVCGMKYKDNIREIADLQPDYMGFIFYPKSKRFVEKELQADLMRNITELEKVGVFVNEFPENILKNSSEYGFSFAQLHGSESPDNCRLLKEEGIKVIKVFSIGNNFDFAQLKKYNEVADFFLFDTATEGHGGSGKKFNWDVLKKYEGTKSYFLSGGIGPEDAEEILNLKDKRIHAVDINSKFEVEPGRKDSRLVAPFIKMIK